MKKEISDEQLIALIEGEPNDDLQRRVENDPILKKRMMELRDLVSMMESSIQQEVPAHIGLAINDAVQEAQGRDSSNSRGLRVAAAAALLIVGFAVGRYSGSDNSAEFAALRSEIQSLRELSLTGALRPHSASERIQAVNQIESSFEANPELIAALINTLNSDDSPNVRFAALQALNNYIDQEAVRAELVKSLESQTDPLIQISLISILVEAQERSAIAPLKDLLKQEITTPEVKQQAKVAIEILT